MFETLVFIAMLAAMATMWRRMTALEDRLGDLEALVGAGHRAWQAHEAPGPVAPVFVPPRAAETVPPPPVFEAEPVPEPEPLARPVAATPVLARNPEPADESAARGSAFEDLFGRKLPIWAGGITLAVAGVLVAKYSIDASLLSPIVRFVGGLLSGVLLIGGAEIAHRQEARVADPRVKQALSGAGVATLYASILVATNLYGLVGPLAAFVGMTAVTGLAMLLSIRFGAPSALLGLVGGLAAPALVGSGEPNVPLLACYLALTVGGLCTLSRSQRWMWLGIAALVGGAGWSALLILAGSLDPFATVSVALLVAGLGLGLPLLAFKETRGAMIRTVSAVVAAAQMAALVATGGFSPLHWGLFGLLSVAIGWLAGRDRSLARMPAIGLLLALLLAAIWPQPAGGAFAVVLAGIAIVYGTPAFLRLWRVEDGVIAAAQITVLALGAPLAALCHFHGPAFEGRIALLALGAALIPAAGIARGWRAERAGDIRLVLLATATALLLILAAVLVLPDRLLPIIVALAAVGLLALAEAARDRFTERSGWGFGALTITALAATISSLREPMALVGLAETADPGAVLRWLVPALAAAGFAWRGSLAPLRLAAQGAAVLLGYGAVAQVVPGPWMPIVTAAALPAIVVAARRLAPASLHAALATAGALAVAWMALPVLQWLGWGLLSLAGDPMLASLMPGADPAIRRILVPVVLLALALHQARPLVDRSTARIVTGGLAVAGGVALHILYKQIFGLADDAAVVRLALAERCLWEALLFGAALALWRLRRWPTAAAGLTAAAFLHGAIYTVLFWNPLWTAQAVGAVPLLNLLVPAFGLPALALRLAVRVVPWAGGATRHGTFAARLVDGAWMVLILLYAFATLRQIAVGSILTVPGVGAGEDIARSVLAIALAGGSLWWGTRGGGRDWRFASLALMLGAVAKVFLSDAAGLEGLLRIASFAALGFSLIAIGWFYSRFLRREG